MIVVSVHLPSDALSQRRLSYLGFSYLGRGVSFHGCSSKTQPLLLTLDERYLLTATSPDLEHGVAFLSPPMPTQPSLLGQETWNVRSMNQGKLEEIKQEMARVNVIILGITELKWI